MLLWRRARRRDERPLVLVGEKQRALLEKTEYLNLQPLQQRSHSGPLLLLSCCASKQLGAVQLGAVYNAGQKQAHTAAGAEATALWQAQKVHGYQLSAPSFRGWKGVGLAPVNQGASAVLAHQGCMSGLPAGQAVLVQQS